jgi:hypothetical protein
MTLNWGCRLSLCTTHCGSPGSQHAALCLSFPMWAVGRTQSRAAEMSGLWYQHARAIFLPATSSHPASLGGPAATFAFFTPDSGGHRTQCDIQPRVGKS